MQENSVHDEENAEEVHIDLSDPAVQEFKAVFEDQYQKYCESLCQEYLKVRKAYTDDLRAKFDEVHNEHKAQYETRNQKISGLGDDLNFNNHRMDHLLESVENFIWLKRKRLLLRRSIDSWKMDHKAEKDAKARKIYVDNYSKRRLVQRGFLGWRKQTHLAKKRAIEQEYAFKIEQIGRAHV